MMIMTGSSDAPLNIPFDETILYRMHVRGFTKHATSKVKHKGTYLRYC